jgi:hypothetical protein
MCIGLHVKHMSFLPDFNVTRIFSTDFLRTLISNFIEIRLVGAELFHADGWTDMTKLLIAVRNFAQAPKNDIAVLQLRNQELLLYVICSV